MGNPIPSLGTRLSWPNTIFLISIHLVGIGGSTVYLKWVGISLPVVIAFALLCICTGLSITAGYHRLFSHGAYESHTIVRILYLLFGAGAFENSALKWSSDHRRHHAFVDEDEDPYNIRRGFFWAHMGWIFFKDDPDRPLNVPDLVQDVWVRLQHRFYILLAIIMAFLLPTTIGAALGDAIGGLVVLGVLRILVVHHSTFFINSLAHTIGEQPYSTRDSSRDSCVTALATLGEGYHNFHHTFPMDYRNGVRAYQYDPTKWWIRFLSWVGLARKLIKVPTETIQEARWAAQRQVVQDCARGGGDTLERIDRVYRRLVELLEKRKALAAEYARLKHDRSARRDAIRNQRRALQRRLRMSVRVWHRLIRSEEPWPAA